MRLLAFLLLFTFHSVSQAFTFAPTTSLSQPDFLPVEQAFQLSISAPKDGKLFATWQISEGYYLYQKQFGLSEQNVKNLHIAVFPAGEKKQDAYYGDVTVYRHQFVLPIYYDIKLPEGTQVNAILSYQGCADKGLCYAPQKIPIQFTVPALSQAAPKSLLDKPTNSDSRHFDSKKTLPSDARSVSQLVQTTPLWFTLTILFALGLLLSFTPCVLPMVPIVSAIVVGTRHSKLGAFYYSGVYVFAMALTYAAIGALVGIFGTQLNLQAQLQNPMLLTFSAILFIVLALAMFGVYELSLPTTWQQRLNVSNQSKISTWRTTISVFMAGVFSTLIVSPCVSAPLAGVLLYISGQGDVWYGAMMLFIMAIGMGVPLLLVGLFGPKILPRNGEWLHDIKVLMGFGLLAMSIWLVTRWLPANSHLYLWGMLALAMSGYFIHRALHVSSHPVRWFFALTLLCIGFAELIGAMTDSSKPLQPLEKLTTMSAHSTQEVRLFDASITSLKELNRIIENQDPRPIVLDLYADWCISCKIVEDLFASPEILPILSKIQLIRVDVTDNSIENQALMKHFNLFGPPSLVFLDANGKERNELTLMGEPTASLLLERLEIISAQK
ncbi:protein-disulfide reductase DsbD [Marinomonas profundimaris]|uniref:Cytochrome C biogenesis protein n=1 Tax=Marinomonas profundimaris TaxID=1208321 RepID=W1RPU8_9GAMM|nr:protein-disulfide reductase DsbD [Marinomonas profundimaris]ETI58712.1 cytochrome C biogenesis protein [Marinomonas profundimaris]